MPRQDVVVTHAAGYLSIAMAERWISVLEKYFVRGARFRTFHDWWGMTGYDSAARRALTAWVVASASHVASADFLATDRIVRMGITAAAATAALVGLPMHVHAARETFEEAVALGLAVPEPGRCR